MRPLFVISGVFFVLDDVPANWRDIAALNPLLHVTGMMRAAAIPGYDAPLTEPGGVALAGLAVLVAGLLAVRRYGRGAAYV